MLYSQMEGEMAEKRYAIGFDLGGTKMLAALVDENFEIVGRNKAKTGTERDNETVRKEIIACIEELLKDAKVKQEELFGIGIANPGPIDLERGVVLETPNLALDNFPIRKHLEERFDVPVLLENDVNAGTYGEFIRGAAQGFRHVVGLFPGTGIGGGLVLNGTLYRGARGGAGEIGHMVIQVDGRRCGCGNYGCLEALASRTAIAKDLVALAATGQAPTVYKKAGTDILKVKSGLIKKAIDNGEQAVSEVVLRSARYLGVGMGNCVNLFNPEVIVLGGGLVEKLGSPYIREAEMSMRQNGMDKLVPDVEVREAELGDDATVIGAAALLRESIEADSLGHEVKEPERNPD
jgi:glucokinase